MTSTSRASVFFGCALIAATGNARAEGEAPPALPCQPEARREVVLALGYGSIVAPRDIDVYTFTDTAERARTFDGFSVDVTRRAGHFEFGARFWRMGASSDGLGSSAHLLTRWTTEARFYPWRLRTVEPWVGAELGLALADDFAIWDKTDQEAAHRAVSDVRPGLAAGLEVGGRMHLWPLLAIGLRGGLLYLGFDRAGGPAAESPQAAKFFVQPTDYGRRVWLSMALTAELTVPD
jgi:hypothetical protein